MCEQVTASVLKERTERVLKQIKKAGPEHFAMSLWCNVGNEDLRTAAETNLAACETTGCLAGWIVAVERLDVSYDNIVAAHEAACHLGIDDYYFYVGEWPREMREQYDEFIHCFDGEYPSGEALAQAAEHAVIVGFLERRVEVLAAQARSDEAVVS